MSGTTLQTADAHVRHLSRSLILGEREVTGAVVREAFATLGREITAARVRQTVLKFRELGWQGAILWAGRNCDQQVALDVRSVWAMTLVPLSLRIADLREKMGRATSERFAELAAQVARIEAYVEGFAMPEAA